MAAFFTNRWVQTGLAVSAIIAGVLVFNHSGDDVVATTEAADTPVTTAASPDNTDAATVEASTVTVELVTEEAEVTEASEATE